MIKDRFVRELESLAGCCHLFMTQTGTELYAHGTLRKRKIVDRRFKVLHINP